MFVRVQGKRMPHSTHHLKKWRYSGGKGIKVFSCLEGSPIIDIKKTSEELGLSYNATANAVNKLIDLGILIQTENVQRNRVFSYEAYLNILRQDT